MANRNFNRRQALEKEVKDLYARVSIGATGAPTLVSPVGIASISRSGTGAYTLTLQDKYSSLKFFDASAVNASADDLNIQIVSESVASTQQINFLTQRGGSAVDPANGTVLLLKIEVKNTSVV